MSSGNNSFSKDEVAEKFKEILRTNKINHEVAEVLVNDGGTAGEGFASQTKSVTIRFRDPDLKPLNLFVKSVTSNASHTAFLEDSKLFEKEALFFTRYVPAVKEFLRTKGHEHLLGIYPKCYYGDKEMIVLENIVKDKGFKLLEKVEKQDFEASSLALSTLATHHAISHAFIKESGGLKEFVQRFPNIDFEAFEPTRALFEPAIENGIKTNIEILKNSKCTGTESAIEVLKAKQGNAWNHIMEISKSDPNDPLLLLNHGDFWNNNMLFGWDETQKKLLEHVAIDFQVTRIDSPGADLGYYFYTSVKPEVRQNRFKELLNIYLDKFNEIADKLDHPLKLTYDVLFQNFRKKFEYGFWFFGIMTATKAAYSVMKDIDIQTVEMSQWATVFDNFMQKWILANPEDVEKDAIAMVDLFKEYKKLTLQS